MNTEQWNLLVEVIEGRLVHPLPTGFIVDSPWLPGWHGIDRMDYYTSDPLWFEANQAAIETFPDTMFRATRWST